MEQSKIEQLLKLENRILEDRKNLIDITKDIGNIDSEFYQNRIAMLERELDYMSRQLRYMKGAYVRTQEVKSQETRPQEIRPQEIRPQEIRAQEIRPREVRPVEKNPWYVRPDYPISGDEIDKPTNSNKDLEKAFGKSFMGIAASVLVFISLILFATLLLPKLGDGAKMAIMYIVSFAFLFAGAYRMSKDKDNRFNIALTGCGLGAVYISLLLTNIYFKVIGDIALYILIAFWGGIVCFFAKNKNYIFQIIGEAGILIATIFGCALCIDLEDSARFIALLIFYGITSAIYYVINYEREFEDNLCYHIFAAVGSVVVTVGCRGFIDDNSIVCFIVAAAIMILNIVGIMCHSLNKQQESFGIISSAYMICLTVVSSLIVSNEEIWGIVAYAMGMIMIIISNLKKCEEKVGIYILATTSAIISLVGLCISGSAYNYGAIWLMVIPLLIYGYAIKDDFCKLAGLFVMFMYLIVYGDISEGLHFLYMLVAFAVAYGCMFYCKKQYSIIYKNVLHIGALLFIITQMHGALIDIFADSDNAEQIIWTIVYVCFFSLNTICYKSKFAYNFATGAKEENDIIYVIANAIAMALGLLLITDLSLLGCHLICIMVALAAFMLKSKSILDNKDAGKGLHIYVGGKFTVFLIVVLSSMEAVNYVISIACLLLAILFILIGFKGGYKYLRIYGLGLTMISIFKLLMIDVIYENTLGYAISFFVSGVLCFVISMIYNYLDKKMNE